MIKQFTNYRAIDGVQPNDICIIGKPNNCYDVVRYMGKNSKGRNRLNCLAPAMLTLSDAVNIANTYEEFKVRHRFDDKKYHDTLS